MDRTCLDDVRAEYVSQIVTAVLSSDGVLHDIVDSLLIEWGSRAYHQGREHMAERIKKCADEFKNATN